MPTSVHIPTAAELVTRVPGQTVEAHYNAVRAARDAHYERVQVIRRRSEVSHRDLTKSVGGAINAAATANNYVLLYGDFTNFVIVDRIGTTLELVPHLFGANQRPTGQRGALLWFRTGSDVVVPNAFRLLDVPTTT